MRRRAPLRGVDLSSVAPAYVGTYGLTSRMTAYTTFSRFPAVALSAVVCLMPLALQAR